MLVHAIVRRETNLWASEFESAGIRIIRVVGTINGVEKRDEKPVQVSSGGVDLGLTPGAEEPLARLLVLIHERKNGP